MGALYTNTLTDLDQTNPPVCVNTSPINSCPGGGGASVWAHGLSCRDPLLATEVILIVLHLKSANNAFNGLTIAGVDATNITVNNAAPLADDYWIQVMTLPQWLGRKAGSPGVRNFHREVIAVPNGAGFPFGPANLRDEGGGLVQTPWVMGAAPQTATAGYWCRADMPLLADVGSIENDGAAPQSYICSLHDFHSVQRIGTMDSPDHCLMSMSIPYTIPPLGFHLIPHLLEVDGVGVVPDLVWCVPIGGPADGVPMTASAFVLTAAVGPVGVVWENWNPNPGEDVTIVQFAMYAWSGGRYV